LKRLTPNWTNYSNVTQKDNPPKQGLKLKASLANTNEKLRSKKIIQQNKDRNKSPYTSQTAQKSNLAKQGLKR
jgi:hypothetical protein